MTGSRRPQRGEIWWAYTPGQPNDPHQPRPVLVVSNDIRNRLADDVVVIPIFSRGFIGPTRVRIQAGEGGIKHDSVLFCEEITTIVHDFVDLRAGPFGPAVSATLLDAVVRAIVLAVT